jgi:L-amino acid N-acyltransferase YncA
VALTVDARAVVADEGGKIVGMVAFDSWTENAAFAHMAVTSPRVWLRLLRPAFQYIFGQARKGVILAAVSAHNPRSFRFVSGIGFLPRFKVKDGQAIGEDLVLFEMRRERCRFLGRH